MAQLTEHFTFRLSPADVATIQAIANAEDRSAAQVIRRMVRKALAAKPNEPAEA